MLGSACIVFVLASSVFAFPQDGQHRFSSTSSYRACFTPGEDCEREIAAVIGSAKTVVRLQAYSFTSKAIAEALLAAGKRGVEVLVILDKSQRTERYSGLTFLRNAGIEVRIDERVAIAHNKVIIVDDDTVVTGSFNFTKSAQTRNAENVLVIRGDAPLARRYTANFLSRWKVSN
jgi:phosphatidylserine/phosphatidylglycerophosphate/cardiolipin synthase-like enzyme